MSHGDPPVGSVAEEAAKLLGLLSGENPWENPWEAGVRASARSGPCPTCGRDSAPGASAPGTGREAVCRYCPVCQLVGFLRGISPEFIDRIADIVDLFGGGLRDLAESRRGHAGPPPSPEGPTDPTP